MSRFKLHTLDDLDKEDIVKAFNEAYAQLESISLKLDDYPDICQHVDSLIVDIDALATRFEEAEYAADVYAQD